MSTLITDKVDKAAVHNEKLDTSAYLPHTLAAIFTGLLPVCAMGHGGQPE